MIFYLSDTHNGDCNNNNRSLGQSIKLLCIIFTKIQILKAGQISLQSVFVVIFLR